MRKQLSFSDREQLLDTLHALGRSPIELESLLQKTAEWANRLTPKYGFEISLLRNVVQLSSYLRDYATVDDISSIARGAIRFVIEQVVDDRSIDAMESGGFHRLSQAFIANYAVHEIAKRLGKPITYHPPSITKDEQIKAERIFEDLSISGGDDHDLLTKTQHKLDGIKNLADCGFLKRFTAHATALAAIVLDEKSPVAERNYARGALRYFVEDHDAVDDGLGLVGYLDDLFILQTAIDLISPQREPLIELLDEVVAAWPFLNMLSLDDGYGPKAASEFAILNAAMSCRSIRSAEDKNTFLITPETGPIAILVGFIASLGLAHEAGKRQIDEHTFRPGQRVLLDYEAVAEFDGIYDEPDGRRMFRLIKRYTDRGEQCVRKYSWPLSDLERLAPVDKKRVVRGELGKHKRDNSTEITGLSFHFNGPMNVDVHAIAKRIIVVAPTTVAADFCRSTILYGVPICDVVPCGLITATGDVASWSSHFGKQPPVLLFTSDLDTAYQYSEEHRLQESGMDVELVVADLTGRNREKHSAIRQLSRLPAPCLMVVTERVANDTSVDQHKDFAVWEWGADDLSSLTWPSPNSSKNARGTIATFENRIVATISNRPTIMSFSLALAEESYQAFMHFRRLAKKRGQDVLAELDEAVTASFHILTFLMRCPVPLSQSPSSQSRVQREIATIENLCQRSKFLTSEERAGACVLTERLQDFSNHICNANPKFDALKDYVASHRNASIFCPDARLLPELQSIFRNSKSTHITPILEGNTFEHGLVIPGWFREKHMAMALSPPVSNPVALILYEAERRWFAQFTNFRNEMRERRSRLTTRSSIFPRISGWKKQRVSATTESATDIVPVALEAVHSDIDSTFIRRVSTQFAPDGNSSSVNARLVVFGGGLYGVTFTDNYSLNVVTHLLDGSESNDDDTARVLLTKAKDIKLGDSVVFRTRSRDLIREVADELLQPGQRDLASLWQRSLIRYVEDNNVDCELLCRQLQKAGCKCGVQAVKNWLVDVEMIAPLQYKSDIPAIARLIGDEHLNEQLDKVIDAITNIRSAHLQAPRIIASRIRSKAAEIVRQEQSEEPVVQLGDDIVLVRVIMLRAVENGGGGRANLAALGL